MLSQSWKEKIQELGLIALASFAGLAAILAIGFVAGNIRCEHRASNAHARGYWQGYEAGLEASGRMEASVRPPLDHPKENRDEH